MLLQIIKVINTSSPLKYREYRIYLFIVMRIEKEVHTHFQNVQVFNQLRMTQHEQRVEINVVLFVSESTRTKFSQEYRRNTSRVMRVVN